METNQNQELVITNAFSVSMFENPRRLIVEFRRISPEELRAQGEIRSYVRHPATVQVLNQLLQRELPVNSGLYVYRGERIVMVVLNTPQRGQEVAPRPEDLLFYEVRVIALE